MKLPFLKETLSLLALGNKIRDSLHRLGLLFLRRDRGGQISFLRPVVAELGVVAAFDLYNMLCVVDLVLHTLVQGAIDGEGIGRDVYNRQGAGDGTALAERVSPGRLSAGQVLAGRSGCSPL